jgi:sialic acid synthase SpsE/RimJ/RimL family protein N-acetyltransferase
MERGFEIWRKAVRSGGPSLIVAEAGSNHNRSLELAHRLIDEAARAQADAIKFQSFEAQHLYPRSAGTSDYLGLETPIYDIIEAMELPVEWLEELKNHSHEVGLAFLTSPFHEGAVDQLAGVVDAFKVASYELTHEPLLRAVARKGLPVILSTGASDLEECRRALEVLREAGCRDVVVLQCTASYPTPPEAANVRALVSLREAFGVLTGLSDHTREPTAAPMAAAALGAVMIEKHFTLDRGMSGPDHAFAVEPDEMARLVVGVRRIEAVLGSGDKRVHVVEQELRAFARRALFTTHDIAAGERFSAANVAVLRAGKLQHGLPPSEWERVLGAASTRDLAAETPLLDEHVGDCPVSTGQQAILALRPARAEDRDVLLEWANDPETRAVSFRGATIGPEEHRVWFDKALSASDRRLLVVEERSLPVGLIRLDFAFGDRATAEVSINMAPGARGRGLGRQVLDLAKRMAAESGTRTLVALIRPENGRSIRAFVAAGFAESGESAVAGVRAKRYLVALD